MEPVVEWALEAISMDVDLLGKLALKSWEHVVKLQSVSAEVDPRGLGGEDGKSLAGPETIGLAPGGDVWEELLCVFVKTFHVAFPLEGSSLSAEVLDDDLSPLGVRHLLVNPLDGLGVIHLLDVQVSDILDVLREFLISSIVSVVEGTSIQAHNSSESVHVVDCSCSGNLSTESVSSNSSHGDLVFVHVSDNVV